MRSYDPNLPLVFIHVPKTAGVSVRAVFADWFGDRLIQHYFNSALNRAPVRNPLFEQHTLEAPVCVYGHFNRDRGFGIAHNYPDARQFITILRDPFEHACSAYFYLQKIGRASGSPRIPPETDLATYLDTKTSSIFKHFPYEVTPDNYRAMIETNFIEVGITENLPGSLIRIAAALGRDFDPASLERLNVTERQTDGIDLVALRERYRDRYPFQYTVYNYVRDRFEAS